MNNDLNETGPLPRKYQLEKPLPGFPVGHIFKVDRKTDCVHFCHEPTQASMNFPRSFINAFPGWFKPIEEEQRQMKL